MLKLFLFIFFTSAVCPIKVCIQSCASTSHTRTCRSSDPEARKLGMCVCICYILYMYIHICMCVCVCIYMFSLSLVCVYMLHIIYVCVCVYIYTYMFSLSISLSLSLSIIYLNTNLALGWKQQETTSPECPAKSNSRDIPTYNIYTYIHI